MFYLVYVLGNSKCFLRVYSLVQFEILGIFSRFFQKYFHLAAVTSSFFFLSQMRYLSHSKLLICLLNLLVVVVTRKCVGWGEKVLFWGGGVGRGRGQGVVWRRGVEIYWLFWGFYKRNGVPECFILVPRISQDFCSEDKFTSCLLLCQSCPLPFSKHTFKWKSKIFDLFFLFCYR